MRGKPSQPETVHPDKTAYRARFADGFAIPEQAMIFAGISMKLQPKLAGRKLDAFAELFATSKTKYKFAYLGDALQRFNSAALYIIGRISTPGPPVKDDAEWNPDIYCAQEKLEGNAWCASHEIKFNPKHARNVIIRDSETIITKNFEEYLHITVHLYLQQSNLEFIRQVDDTVRQYMMRNKINVPLNSKVEFDFSLERKNDLIDQCVISFIQRKRANSTISTESSSYLENPVYQALLKLSFSYVLYELTGFRVALQKIKEGMKPQDHTNLPIYFLYPGKLAVVVEYFKLLQGFNVIAKEISYKAITPVNSAGRYTSAAQLQLTDEDASLVPMDETSSGESPPTEQEVLLLMTANIIASKTTGSTYSYQDQLRTMRGLFNANSFAANIGTLTNRRDEVINDDGFSLDESP